MSGRQGGGPTTKQRRSLRLPAAQSVPRSQEPERSFAVTANRAPVQCLPRALSRTNCSINFRSFSLLAAIDTSASDRINRL
jgi:hypothetical protein